MNYKIEIVTKQDIKAAADVCARSLGEDNRACAEIDFALHLTDTPYPPLNLVAKTADGLVVGTIQSCISYFGPKVRGIAWLCVHPDYHQQGLGEALLKYCENFCQKKFWNNEAGSFVLITKNYEDFYSKRGYKTVAKDWCEKPLMMKNIPTKS